jgi:hypothetical protein
MIVLNSRTQVTQLFFEKLIAELNTLWRAEKHFWNSNNEENGHINFPVNYVIRKQKTLNDLITHLHSLLFSNENEKENRPEVLDVLADYIDIEYKLSSLLIEKEKRIYQLVQSETNPV